MRSKKEDKIITALRKTREELWEKKVSASHVMKGQVTKSKKPDPKSAQKHLENIYRLMSKRKSPFEGMSEDEIIAALRKTREYLWEKKLASRS
jgi:hypothetical protein